MFDIILQIRRRGDEVIPLYLNIALDDVETEGMEKEGFLTDQVPGLFQKSAGQRAGAGGRSVDDDGQLPYFSGFPVFQRLDQRQAAVMLKTVQIRGIGKFLFIDADFFSPAGQAFQERPVIMAAGRG